MRRYLLHHRHGPSDCGTAFAAWKGFDSPLRHELALSSCLEGGHTIWWTVDANDRHSALELLPQYVAERTNVIEISEVAIP
jgi:hypothetical protein